MTLELPKSVVTYRPAVETILAWMPDWISQDEFDSFCERERIMDRAWFMDEETVFLGEPGGMKKELHLLQHMIHIGLVELKTGVDKLIYYRRKIAEPQP